MQGGMRGECPPAGRPAQPAPHLEQLAVIDLLMRGSVAGPRAAASMEAALMPPPPPFRLAVSPAKSVALPTATGASSLSRLYVCVALSSFPVSGHAGTRYHSS